MATSARTPLDLSDFPPATVTEYTTLLCLACIFEIFTTQMRLAPRTAYSEVKRYSPTIKELTSVEAPLRPFFDSDEKNPRCPYCNGSKRVIARIDTVRIAGEKPTDKARRALLKSLPKSNDQFQVMETKGTRRALFFEWLDTLGQNLDFEDDRWLIDVARSYLERKELKTDWSEVFEKIRAVRRSHRLEEGWERDGARLFLAPSVFSEILLVQYLVSRSHKHGGRTFEGRLTLLELVRRLRYTGQLDLQGITERDQFEVLEKLVDNLTGGETTLKLHYIVDRRDFLEKVKTTYARYAS